MKPPNCSDPLPARLDPQSIRHLLQPGHSQTVGNMARLTIRSHFQPIFSVAHSRAVGFEDLMRPSDATGHSLSPLDAFKMGRDISHVLTLDRLASAVHVHNFLNLHADGWLFLNMNTDSSTTKSGRSAITSSIRGRSRRPTSATVPWTTRTAPIGRGVSTSAARSN